MGVRAALRPLVSRSTYRAWAWLTLGGAVLMPYVMAGEVAAVAAGRSRAEPFVAPLSPETFLMVLPVVALTGLFLPVRPLLVLTARGLLGAAVPAATEPRDWPSRFRTAAWYLVQLAVGGLVSGVTLALVPFVLISAVLPLLPDPAAASGDLLDLGWQLWFGPVLGPLALVLLVYLVAGVGAVLRRAAPVLLGPTSAQRLAAAQEHAARLAARNLLARELHDSVGHALSVVTLQAAAAGRMLDRDPARVRQALTAVEETARRALTDLDHALGVLREDGSAVDRPAPQPGVAQLPQLISECGLQVEADLSALGSDLPGTVSREAYRIAQEALTNALRHGAAPTASLRVTHDGGDLLIEVSNPVAPGGDAAPRAAGAAGAGRVGRGLAGMRERVAVLGGDLSVVVDRDRWRVTARLPLGEEAG